MSPDTEKAAKAWKEGARDAFDTAEKLYVSKKYHHALFFCHLAVEKALKATYILAHTEMPPHTHDLVLLASRTNTTTEDELKMFAEINKFNIAARYQEEKDELYKKATAEYAQEWIQHTSLILKSLL